MNNNDGHQIIDPKISHLIAESIGVEHEFAKQSEALGFMARALVQAAIPHSRTSDTHYKKTNGQYSLIISANPDIGLPYGNIPRLEMVWITTEAVKNRNREIVLGNSLNAFMSELGIPRTGKYIERFKDQTKRLFSCSISCTYDDGKTWKIENIRTVKSARLAWSQEKEEGLPKDTSTLILDQDFYDEIISRPVPIDLDAIKRLKSSSLALDIYTWLTYRMSYLSQRTCIPWDALHNQFGSNYADDKSGKYAFKKKFTEQMLKVLAIYSDARVEKDESGLVLYPSKTHIKKILAQPHASQPKKTTSSTQQQLKRYEEYRLNQIGKAIKEIENKERTILLEEFRTHLLRHGYEIKNILTLEKLIKKDKAVNQHLLNFVTSHYPDILKTMKSLSDFD